MALESSLFRSFPQFYLDTIYHRINVTFLECAKNYQQFCLSDTLPQYLDKFMQNRTKRKLIVQNNGKILNLCIIFKIFSTNFLEGPHMHEFQIFATTINLSLNFHFPRTFGSIFIYKVNFDLPQIFLSSQTFLSSSHCYLGSHLLLVS